MKKYSLLLALFPVLVMAQPQLTKDEMRTDFDYLVNIIREVNPQLEVIRQVTGKDILSEIKYLRTEIDTITTFSSFYKLLKRVLHFTQDKHNDFMYYSNEWGGLVIDDTIVNQSNLIIKKGWSFQNPHLIGVFYVNGTYYYTQDITTVPQEKNRVLFPKGTQILKIDGLDIDAYLLKLGEKRGSSLRWDAKQKKYYTKHDLCINRQSKITVKMPDGESRDVRLDTTPRRYYRGIVNTDEDEVKVLYFSAEAILYIRVPEMDYEQIDFYTSEIAKMKDVPINKVVIDIRGNTGGSDRVWRNILSALIDKPVIYPVTLLFKNTPTVISYLNKVGDYPVSSIQNNEVMIGRDAFFQLTETDTIPSGINSINYTGNIYVLADERCFSSAGSLLSVCGKTDKLVSIGQLTGNINGIGINPFIFSLPQSKLIFRMVASLEGITTNNMEDYYHNTIEIPIEKSLQEVLFEQNWDKELYGKEYLFNYDSTFQKVLEL
jgi:hypothetical protein